MTNTDYLRGQADALRVMSHAAVAAYEGCDADELRGYLDRALDTYAEAGGDVADLLADPACYLQDTYDYYLGGVAAR